MSGNANVRHVHSSNSNPVAFDKVSRILFLDETGDKVLKIVEPSKCSNLLQEVEKGNLLFKQDQLLNQKNALGDRFTPQMQAQLDDVSNRLEQ